MTDSQSTSSNAATDSAAQTAVGALLRQSREGVGLNIADAARALRISQKYLEALEDGRHADLPGTAYAIGFVRSYAEHLHLDSDEIVRRYKGESSGIGNKNDLVFPKPIVDGGVPGGAVLGLGVMVAAVAYGVWYWNSTNTEVEIARVEVVPEHMAVQEPAVDRPAEQTPVDEQRAETATPDTTTPSGDAPVETSVETPAETPVETAVDDVPAQQQAGGEAARAEPAAPALSSAEATEPVAANEANEPANTETATASPSVEDQKTPSEQVVEPEAEADAEAAVEPARQSVVEAAAEPEQAVDEAEATSAVQAGQTPSDARAETPDAVVATATPAQRQDDGPSRITVRAKSNSWIQVRDEIADRLLFTRLLREGQEYQVPNRDGLRLMTGNAGALELLVDGTAVPAIGAVGEVRRNVELDVDKLQNGSAVSE